MPTNAMPTGIEPCCNWNFFMPNSTNFALYILPLNSVTIALSSVFTPISIHVSSLLILYFLYQRNNHKYIIGLNDSPKLAVKTIEESQFRTPLAYPLPNVKFYALSPNISIPAFRHVVNTFPTNILYFLFKVKLRRIIQLPACSQRLIPIRE